MADNDCCGDFGFRAWAGKGRRQFRWRIFERGDLKFVILRMVSQKPMHGYEVMQALEEESGGCYKPSPGSVYPTLQMLEDEGLVRSREEEGGKKIYEITDQGREYLDQHGDVVDEIFDRVGSFADRFLGRDSRELSAAFSRLAQSTFDGAFAWDMGPETVKKMTEVLEQARKDLEDLRGGSRDAGGGKESSQEDEEQA